MYKRKRAGNTITRKINSTKDTAAKADKDPYISNSYLEGFIPIDTEYFTASFPVMGLMCFKWHPSDRGGSAFAGRLGYSTLRIVSADPQSVALLHPQQRIEPV